MSTETRILYLRFGITSMYSNELELHGPLFTRWLPDGKKDAIKIELHPNWQLEMWFERRGFKDEMGFIAFDWDKKEVDPTIMTRQGVLCAGYLLASLKIEQVSESAWLAVTEKKVGDADYIAFAKLVHDMVHEHLNRLFDILRVTYGQYWISPLRDYGGSRWNIANYFHQLQAKWSLTADGPREHFHPMQFSAIQIDSPMKTEFPELLSQKDWYDIHELMQKKFNPSPAAALLVDAHRLLDLGDLAHALIRGTTAYEIVLKNYLESLKAKIPKALQEGISYFGELNNYERIALVACMKNLNNEDVERADKAVDARNDYAHDGVLPYIELSK